MDNAADAATAIAAATDSAATDVVAARDATSNAGMVAAVAIARVKADAVARDATRIAPRPSRVAARAPRDRSRAAKE